MPAKQAKNAPRPGSFAAWVVAQPLTESPTECARRARALKWPNAKPQSVYNVRWYYRLTEADHATRPMLTDAAVASRAARIATHRATAPGYAPHGRPTPAAELVAVITRYGTDAALEVINRIEARFGIVPVATQRSA
jgi:hypothetical protein